MDTIQPQFKQNPPTIPFASIPTTPLQKVPLTAPPPPASTVTYTAKGNKLQSSKKVILIIIAGILLAAIPFGALLLLQPKKVDTTLQETPSAVAPTLPPPVITPTPTTIPQANNLKTYNSLAGKYSIKYPDTLVFNENQITVNNKLVAKANTIQLTATSSPQFQLQSSFKNIGAISNLKDYITKQGYCITKFPDKQISTVVGGKDAFFADDITCGNKKVSAYITYSNPFIYDFIIESSSPFSVIKPSVDQIISSVTFSDPSSVNVLAATTVDDSILKKWPEYKDNKFTFSFRYPTDWLTVVKDYEDQNTHVINIAKKDTPTTFSISFTIKPNWDSLGLVQYEKKNFEVGNVQAFKTDPPKLTEKKLDQYISNVYFENEGKVFVFACVHNWNEDYINTCNQILSTVHVGN